MSNFNVFFFYYLSSHLDNDLQCFFCFFLVCLFLANESLRPFCELIQQIH